ncbi:MAG: substrate-binding domain-containing protein [Anaerolineae bacterium]|jgi:molybdate-binding protein/DNA-binding transcriptional regulator YhcF (GntR family)
MRSTIAANRFDLSGSLWYNRKHNPVLHMDEAPLYQQVAESLRQEILSGHLRPGDPLPPVREMARRWHCTVGTVQRAYQELARQGLVIARRGQGTRVAGEAPASGPLRHAALVHQAESFLLRVISAGYEPAEVEQAVRLALDRWRALTREPPAPEAAVLRFSGSHDLLLARVAAQFSSIAPGYTLRLTFTGSLGGLMALAQGIADLAGCHLWDAESDTYNVPFVRRLLPGRRVALVTLAHRRVGLLLAPGNPLGLQGLADLARPGLRFVGRPRGTGTRVWLDAQMRRLGLAWPSEPTLEVATHSELAQALAEGRADVGLGIEAAARVWGLDFVPLTRERYDLVIPAEIWETPPVAALARWLASEEPRALLTDLRGYETEATGRVEWVEG